MTDYENKEKKVKDILYLLYQNGFIIQRNPAYSYDLTTINGMFEVIRNYKPIITIHPPRALKCWVRLWINMPVIADGHPQSGGNGVYHIAEALIHLESAKSFVTADKQLKEKKVGETLIYTFE